MRVITFDKKSARDLQAAVQKWLDENNGVTIYAMSQSHGANNDVILTIIYTE
jgi:hypothetical protein